MNSIHVTNYYETDGRVRPIISSVLRCVRCCDESPTRWKIDVEVHRPKRSNQLCEKNRYMAWAHAVLFDDERTTRQTGISANCRSSREYRPVEQLIPNRQGKSQIHILRSVEFVVNTMIIRTYKHTP